MSNTMKVEILQVTGNIIRTSVNKETVYDFRNVKVEKKFTFKLIPNEQWPIVYCPLREIIPISLPYTDMCPEEFIINRVHFCLLEDITTIESFMSFVQKKDKEEVQRLLRLKCLILIYPVSSSNSLDKDLKVFMTGATKIVIS